MVAHAEGRDINKKLRTKCKLYVAVLEIVSETASHRFTPPKSTEN